MTRAEFVQTVHSFARGKTAQEVLAVLTLVQAAYTDYINARVNEIGDSALDEVFPQDWLTE